MIVDKGKIALDLPKDGTTLEELIKIMLASRGVHWDAVRVLDVFAGSGSLGWEALSRGAPEVCFLENDPKALRLLRDQAPTFERPGQRVRILAGDALRTLAGAPRQARPGGYGVLFFDPPYGRDLLAPALALARNHGWIAPDALICAEVEEAWTPAALTLPELELETDRTYGQTRICIWTTRPPSPTS